MAPEAQAAARAFALDVIRDWRDRGCPEPEPVSAEMVKQMMAWIVGAEVRRRVRPDDARGARARRRRPGELGAPVGGAADYPVVVIGAGMSGLLAAIRLAEAGFPFVIVEKNAGPGGTWWENSYPGARVDVGNHFYCYSFEPSDHWTEYFAQQPELQAYFQRVVRPARPRRAHPLLDRGRSAPTWDEASRHVVGRARRRHDARRACGRGRRRPDEPARPSPRCPATFDGPAFHTARWDHDVDLTGKRGGDGRRRRDRVPGRAGDRRHASRSLTVVQRTAQWMFPNPGYHDPVGPGVGWAIRHLPFYGRWFRFLIFWPGCDAGLAAAKVDPDWEPQATSVSEVNDLVREMFTEWITSQLPDDPELVAKVVPTTRPPASAPCRTTAAG